MHNQHPNVPTVANPIMSALWQAQFPPGESSKLVVLPQEKLLRGKFRRKANDTFNIGNTDHYRVAGQNDKIIISRFIPPR